MGFRLYLISNRKRTLEWCLRTCFCTAIATFLCLYNPTKSFISYNGQHKFGLPFSIFINIIVKDSTLGATIFNSWVVLIGAVIASFFTWWTTLLLGEHYSFEYCVVIMFILAFAVQYVEFNFLGKRVGLSVLALSFLLRSPPNQIQVWRLCGDVLLGSGIAVIGNFLPVPKLASTEVESISRFMVKNISALLDSLMISIIEFNSNNVEIKDKRTDDSYHQLHNGHHLSDIEGITRINIEHIVDNNISPYSSIMSGKNANIKYIRQEICLLLEKSLQDFQSRNNEARFAYNRYRAVHRYSNFSNMIRKLIIIMEALEWRITKLSSDVGDNIIMKQFVSREIFCKSICNVSMKFRAAVEVLSDWIGEKAYYPSDEAIEAIDQLRRSVIDLDRAYEDTRRAVLYNLEDTTATLTLSLDPELLLNLNSCFFLIDSACKLVQECEPLMKRKDGSGSGGGSEVGGGGGGGRESVATTPIPASTTTTTTSSIRKKKEFMSFYSYLFFYLEELKLLSRDLIPPQSHLFQLSYHQPIPTVIAMRFRTALTVSVSMVLAAIYSYYSHQSDMTFAAFTICYLTGGAVAGASIITSFNRAVGTVVACVYCLLVAKIITGWDAYSGDWFVGVAIVLAQLPSTYVRSIPKYGYAGTVFGFTVPILLISFQSFNADAALQRIVDTVVAVTIFVIIELLFLGRHYSEDLLLHDTKKIFTGIEVHFQEFIETFKSFKNDSQLIDEANREKILTKKVSSPSFLIDIKRQRELMRFVSIELSLWRPKPFRQAILQELLQYEERAHKCIEIMSWAVQACHLNNIILTTDTHAAAAASKDDDLLVSSTSSFTFLLAPLEKEVVAVESLIVKVCQKLKEGVAQLMDVTVSDTKIKRRHTSQDILQLLVETQTDQMKYISEMASMVSHHHKEELELFDHFRSLALQLQGAYRDSCYQQLYSTTTTAVSESKEKPLEDSSSSSMIIHEGRDKTITTSPSTTTPAIVSNAEVKIVSAALVSLRDLLDAMSGLAKTIVRMQSYRAVQLTESKYFFLRRLEKNHEE